MPEMEDLDSIHQTVYRTVSYEDVPEDWWLITSPYPVMTCLLLYLLVVTLGPRLMRSRDPFQLTTTLRVYNVLQVLLNTYICSSVVVCPKYTFIFINNVCTMPDGPHLDGAVQHVVKYSWIILVSKILDLLDTVFMVLRKKNSHITFLHVYHHVAMVFFLWYTYSHLSFYPAVPLPIINAFVHTVMYTYYFLATFPGLKKHLWWKRHLTKLQLVQFVIILLYLYMTYSRGCSISHEFSYIWIFNVFVFLLMFINFYVKAYFFKTKEN